MREAVEQLWPELSWIQSPELRASVTRTWEKALEESPLTADDLREIPFTLLIENCPATFMEHKRCVVHIARKSAEAMQEFLGRALPIDMDTVIAGAILADVGKLLEYELVAVVALAIGYVPVGFGVHPLLCLVVGTAVLAVLLRVFGRQASA